MAGRFARPVRLLTRVPRRRQSTFVGGDKVARNWQQIVLNTDFLSKVPKTDLHVHLDGSVRLSTLIELSKQKGLALPSYTAEGLKQLIFKDNYQNLEEYLAGFPLITNIMKDPEDLERVAYEFAMDNYNENVRYFEARFAPQLHADPNKGIDVVKILEHVNAGFARAKEEVNGRDGVREGREPRVNYGIIVCAMRMFFANMSPYYQSFCHVHAHETSERQFGLASTALVSSAIIARDTKGVPVVGLDIAGAEAGFPAKAHAHSFKLAHEAFMAKTVHAGEAWGPESVFQATTQLYAQRIGHGYHVFNVDHEHFSKKVKDRDDYVKRLVQYMGNARVNFEVCLTSNRQTMPWLRDNLAKHTMSRMLSERLSVSVNTDNRLVSDTTVTKELKLAVTTFNLDEHETADLVMEGFRRSFYPGTYVEKREFLNSMWNHFERLQREYGLSPRHVHD